jgi:hypothetical protein
MPSNLPILVIDSPQPGAFVGNGPVTVGGTVTAPGKPEPIAIDAVNIEISGHPTIAATLTLLSSTQQEVQYSFKATVPIAGAQGSLTITVGVKSDVHIPVIKSVTVLAGVVYEPPAFLLDLALPNGDVTAGGPSLASVITSSLQALLPGLATQINQQLAGPGGLLGGLQAAGKILVGPNLLQVSDNLLRFGLWILPANFPAQELVPATNNFPLPQLTKDVATGCFALVPSLGPTVGERASNPAALEIVGFAFSLPTSTLQLIFNMQVPQIAASANFDVSSASLQTDATSTVTVMLSGSYDGISVTAKIEDKLGTTKWTPPSYELPTDTTHMPAVVSSHSSASVGDLLDWVAVTLLGVVTFGWTAIFGVPFLVLGADSYAAGLASSGVTGALTGLLSSLPPWIPFRDSALSIPGFSFPMLVLNFDSFGSTDVAIVGSGSIGLANRDESMVHVGLDGPSTAQSSLGADYYTASLMAFQPDGNQMTAETSGGYPANYPGPITFGVDPFFQQGSFLAKVPPPPGWHGGPYSFTVSCSATETCASDPSLKLTRSVTLPVTVGQSHDH